MVALLITVSAFLALFALWRFFWFFRDPDRTPPPGDGILAPADGFVVYAHRVERGEIPVALKKRRTIPLDELTSLPGLAGASGLQIGIFMTAFNVHVTRAPIAGVVRERIHTPRTRNRTMARMFANILLARRPIADDSAHLVENERVTTVIEGERGIVAVTQIADAWASWVVCNVSPGDHIERGARFGMIRMGSQVDLFIPDSPTSRAEPVCAVGQQIRAGESVVALTTNYGAS
ncbi:MAG: phosphatidylserine decarboxylase [Deltaproteobacteria bacterium]|nr:phosphatidylserine decarboxylase [Deltaproteobacteria bacterium]